MNIIILLLSLLAIALSQPIPAPVPLSAPEPSPSAPEPSPDVPVPAAEAPAPSNDTAVEVPAPQSPDTGNTTVEAPSPEVPAPEETPTPEVPAPEEVPTPEVPAPEESSTPQSPDIISPPSGNLNEPPYYVVLKGANPIGMCQITKVERWVTFFFYSSETDVTKPIKNPTNWASQISADDKEFRNSLSNNSTGYYPGQPTSLKKGFHPAFALSSPFFTVPKGVSGGIFKLQQVKYQLDNAFVIMNVDAPEYNCPATASFLVNYTSDNGAATLNNLEASSDILFQSVNISDTKSRLTITRSAKGTDTTYRFVINKNGYKRPQNLTDIWNTYKNGWPPEEEPAQDWELLFLLISKQDFAADGAGGAKLKGIEILGFKNQAFKLPANALLPDGKPASNPDGTPYDPNWVDPNNPPNNNPSSGNYLISVMAMYLITLSLLFI